MPPTPNWTHAEHLHPRPATTQFDWLLAPDSLTQRLSALADGDFSVHVQHEYWQKLRADECAALGVAQAHRGWVREVILSGHGEPWIFARSVATQRTLLGGDFDLGEVGHRSLGELLFRAPGFSRSTLELCQYPPMYLPLHLRETGLWARRSCFDQRDARILIAEVYLPALWAKLGP